MPKACCSRMSTRRSRSTEARRRPFEGPSSSHHLAHSSQDDQRGRLGRRTTQQYQRLATRTNELPSVIVCYDRPHASRSPNMCLNERAGRVSDIGTYCGVALLARSVGLSGLGLCRRWQWTKRK